MIALRNVASLSAADQSRMMQEQMTMQAGGMPQDPKAAFKAEWEALEITETKMVQAVSKLDKAATASDDSERAKKVFQSKAEEDDKRIAGLEKELKEARDKAETADATYDEASKKLAQCEADLEKAEERADVGEAKIIELEEELRVVANNLKSLEVLNFI